MELPLFDQVGELTRALVPGEVGTVRFRAHRRGVKVWLAEHEGRDGRAPRAHWEAQLIPRRHLDGCDGALLEVGFHAEDGDVSANDATIAALTAAPGWRDVLAEAEVGPFLGRPEDWRRISETWPEPDPDDPELAFEVAARLADYVTSLAPLLHGR